MVVGVAARHPPSRAVSPLWRRVGTLCPRVPGELVNVALAVKGTRGPLLGNRHEGRSAAFSRGEHAFKSPLAAKAPLAFSALACAGEVVGRSVGCLPAPRNLLDFPKVRLKLWWS